MRFLTYNLWHGLSPSSPIAFEALEPVGRRTLREQLQVETIQHLRPDVCFFQEVNPSAARAAMFAGKLQMQAAVQPDLVGLKLFGVGLPLNLNSGLVILAGQNYGLKKVEGVSLSRPGTHLVHGWGSWQLKEERFALFSETMLPRWGKVLLVNTHLHHGLETSLEFLKGLKALARELDLSDSVVSEIETRMAAGSARRAREMEVLLEALAKYERRYEVVMIGGDFNAGPESEVSRMLAQAGFRDVWQEAHPEGGGLSFDGTINVANHLLQERFPLTLVVEDLSFSNKTKESLLALARKQEALPRRIDYLWLRTSSLPLKVTAAQLVGLPNDEGLAPSDHFGVCADIELG